MMEKVRITRNYQITIPASIRASLDLKIGDSLVMYLEGNRIVMEKKMGDVTKIRIRLGKRIDWRYVEEKVAEAIDESITRH